MPGIVKSFHGWQIPATVGAWTWFPRLGLVKICSVARNADGSWQLYSICGHRRVIECTDKLYIVETIRAWAER